MSDDVIARAEAALEGVTDGPWVAEYSGEQGNCVIPHDAQSTREAVCTTHLYYQVADAEFIAAARQLVPELVAELKTTRAQLAAVRELHFYVLDFCDEYVCGSCGQNPCPTLDVIDGAAEAVGDLFPGLFGRGCRETRYGYVTDEEYERRAAEYSAKLDARDACQLCDHDSYRPNMRVCNHIDYGDGSPYREARKRQLQIIEGGDA